MNIYAKQGQKVRFINKNGYDSQLEHARAHLKENEIYTVVKTEVGGWMSYVYLEEVENHSFNTAHFEDANPNQNEPLTTGLIPSADYIMSLPTGDELTALIEESVKKYVDVDYGCSNAKTNWSRDIADAVMLWDIASEHVGTVGIIRVSDAPNIISQMASVGDEKEITTTCTGNWIESLCKAYLLHDHGFYGDYMHPEFKKKMDAAPKRIVQ